MLLGSLVQSVKTNSTPILQIRSVGELSEGEDVLLMASRSRHPPLCSEVKGLEWFDIKCKMLQRLGRGEEKGVFSDNKSELTNLVQCMDGLLEQKYFYISF